MEKIFMIFIILTNSVFCNKISIRKNTRESKKKKKKTKVNKTGNQEVKKILVIFIFKFHHFL